MVDAQGYAASEKYIYHVLKKEGFDRLPRRSSLDKESKNIRDVLTAPQSIALNYDPERFSTAHSIGVLCLLPYLTKYGIDKAMEESGYPGTKSIGKLSSLLSFLALKLSNVRRYSADDLWCMDRGLGLFAGLNVLPKSAWFSSYSSRITREMNRQFLKPYLEGAGIPVGHDESRFYHNSLLGRRCALREQLVRQEKQGIGEYARRARAGP